MFMKTKVTGDNHRNFNLDYLRFNFMIKQEKNSILFWGCCFFLSIYLETACVEQKTPSNYGMTSKYYFIYTRDIQQPPPLKKKKKKSTSSW